MTAKKILLAAAAIAAVAAPGAAQARQGADDPAGHVRHGDDDGPKPHVALPRHPAPDPPPRRTRGGRSGRRTV